MDTQSARRLRRPIIKFAAPRTKVRLPLLDLSDFRLLGIDDHADWRRLLNATFHATNASYLVVASAEEALTNLHSHAPDVIVVNLNMPGMNGEAFIRRLDTDTSFGRGHVIVFSAHARCPDWLRSRRRTHFVDKTAGRAGLITALSSASERGEHAAL